MWRIRWVGSWPLVLVMLWAAFAFADDGSDRSDLMTQIDEKLGEAAESLGRVASASSSSDVATASDDVHQITDLVSRLADIKGDDEQAGHITDSYPEYIESYDDAAASLHDLKDHEYAVDDAPAKCKDAEDKLHELIRDYVGDADDKALEGLDKIPELARQLGSTWSPAVEHWKEVDNQMHESDGKANLSISDGRWSDVSSSLNDATTAVFDHWVHAYADAQAACGRLAQGEQHPDVVKATQDLASFVATVKQTFKQLKADFDAWFTQVKQLREFTDQDLAAIRDAMCNSGEYELEQKVDAVADRWASQISSAYGTVTGQADRLLDRAQGVVKRAPKSTPKLIAAIQDNLKSLARIKDSELLGANNPKIRARLEFGKQEHARLEGACTYSEVAIDSSYCNNDIRPGSGCRLDCINAGSTCEIVEIKPNNQPAIDEGKDQLSAYEAGLATWFTRAPDDLLSKYPELQQCVTGHDADRELHLETRVQPYDFCPSANADVGVEIKEIVDDVPDQATEMNHE